MRVETIGECKLYLGDCREVLTDLSFDAIVTDPPYGIGMSGGNVGYKGANNFARKDWDTSVPDDIIAALIKAKVPTILWGGNYFDLQPSRGWLIWDKGAGFKGRSYAEAELAWTNINMNVRSFSYDPLARGDYKGKLHPTQKPEQLMLWCLSFLPTDARIVLDPFMGSASTGAACVAQGMPFIGIERDPDYFDIACRRIEAAYKQPRLFAEPVAKPVQESLL